MGEVPAVGARTVSRPLERQLRLFLPGNSVHCTLQVDRWFHDTVPAAAVFTLPMLWFSDTIGKKTLKNSWDRWDYILMSCFHLLWAGFLPQCQGVQENMGGIPRKSSKIFSFVCACTSSRPIHWNDKQRKTLWRAYNSLILCSDFCIWAILTQNRDRYNYEPGLVSSGPSTEWMDSS